MEGNLGYNMDNNIKYKLRVQMGKNMIKTQHGQHSKSKIHKTFFSIAYTGTPTRSFNGHIKNRLKLNLNLRINVPEYMKHTSEWLKSLKVLVAIETLLFIIWIA